LRATGRPTGPAARAARAGRTSTSGGHAAWVNSSRTFRGGVSPINLYRSWTKDQARPRERRVPEVLEPRVACRIGRMSRLFARDVHGPTTPWWQEEAPPDDELPELADDIEAEVAIVGG